MDEMDQMLPAAVAAVVGVAYQEVVVVEVEHSVPTVDNIVD